MALSAVLNSELPQNSRLHILEVGNIVELLPSLAMIDAKEFNAGLFDYLIATDVSQSKEKDEAPKEGYVHRIGRTGRGYSSGASISLVSTDEMDTFEEIRSFIGDDENKGSISIAEFPLLTKNAVESLRYRAEDVAKSVTKIVV
ncbi:hypothetical protein RJT34_02716 [Clitoria ternatea]|uniref:Uncharacterized protein n=1 Tax=Clitoria ternatea TaxID=43366 RepID=A0AAN9Q1U7_CLITE